jgi:hypothetical protein
VSQAASIWLVLAVAFAAANLPFFTERLFGAIPLKAPKGLAVRLGELVVLYFAVGALGLLLENRLGRVAPQGWEFYAVTGSLFLVFAFPGFVWRYLFKHRHHG